MTAPLTSVLMGVAGMLGWGLYDFLGGVLSRRWGSFPTLLRSQAAGAVVVVSLAVPVVAWVRVTPSVVGLGLVAACLYCAGYLFFFRGFERGDVSVVAAVMNLWAVVTMLVAFAGFGQRLTTTQTVGAAAIIVGAALASLHPGAFRGGGAVAAGTGHTLAGAVFFGVYWNVSEVVSERVGWLATTALVKAGVVLVLLLVAGARRRAVRPAAAVPAPEAGREQRSGAGGRAARRPGVPWATLAAMGVVEVGAVAAVNYGLAIGDAILVTPVASALSVVTIGLAVAVLGDRLSRLQGAGVLLAVAGIVTTAF